MEDPYRRAILEEQLKVEPPHDFLIKRITNLIDIALVFYARSKGIKIKHAIQKADESSQTDKSSFKKVVKLPDGRLVGVR